ncbi:MAG TPA: hypothetical protein VJ718_09190, partial [Candidatus Binataceae bacterium]|nr:hypothetical protein [Candidatus Binataceae bacterium]
AISSRFLADSFLARPILQKEIRFPNHSEVLLRPRCGLNIYVTGERGPKHARPKSPSRRNQDSAHGRGGAPRGYGGRQGVFAAKSAMPTADSGCGADAQ